MPIFFDGYNLIGRGRRLGLSLEAEGKEKRLLDLLARWRDRKGAREGMLVVFDGDYAHQALGRTGFSHRGISVEFTLGVSADDRLIRKVADARRPREISVVTSDGRVQREVRLLGARVQSSEEFLENLSKVLALAEGEKPHEPGPDEVEEWLRIFDRRGGV